MRTVRVVLASLGLWACGVARLEVSDEGSSTGEQSLVAVPDEHPVPGVLYGRHVVDLGRGPRVFHAITADLADPRLSVKVSRPDEFYRTTSAFARESGAVVAVNGDFFDIGNTNWPAGLTIGDGEHWPGTEDSTGWRVFGCTGDKRCSIEPDEAYTPAGPPLVQAIGGHFIPTLTAGEVMSWDETDACDDYCTGDHPRTAVGLSADGRTLFLVVAEGRIAGTRGPSPREVGLMLRALGAWDGMMLDGGGSSTLAVNGRRANRLPGNGAAERRVANHLALLFDPAGGFGVPPAERTGAGPAGAVSLLAAPGRFSPLASPARLLDTRGGAPLEGGLRRRVDLTPTLPPGATAFVGTLTAADAELPGFLAAVPAGAPRETSNVNFVPGRPVSSAVRVGLSGGAIELEAQVPTHVVLDALGAFGPSGAGFEAQAPVRTADSRGGPPLSPFEVRALPVGGPPDAIAVSVNVTVTQPQLAGWLALFPCDSGGAGTSTVNFVAGEDRANASMARVRAGQVCVQSNVATHVVLDVDGYFRPTGGHRFAPIAPTRVLDTRSGQGEWRHALRAGQVVALELARLPGLPAGTSAVSLGVVAVEPSRPGHLSVRPCDAIASASSLNFAAHDIVANQVTTSLGTSGRVCVSATTDLHLVIDAFGVFLP